jgi:hypothetical protein
MALNDIEFPASLFAELYQNALIPDEKINAPLIHAGPGITIADAPAPAYLGENKKRILVVVKDANHTWINDADLKFLSGILTACGLTIADVAVINAERRLQSFAELEKEFGSRQVLLFGVSQDELQIPLRFPEFQVQTFAGKQFLSAPPLAVISNDRTLKSNLWVSLQKLFNL